MTHEAKYCPRCAQANHCAIAAQLPAEQCWCLQKDSVTSLACSTSRQAVYCLCESCLEGYKRNE